MFRPIGLEDGSRHALRRRCDGAARCPCSPACRAPTAWSLPAAPCNRAWCAHACSLLAHGWHQTGSAYGQRRIHLAQRLVDQKFSIIIGDASDRVVDLYAAPLQFSIKLVRLQFFGVLCVIVVGHGDPPLRTSAPRAQNSVLAFPDKQSSLLSLTRNRRRQFQLAGLLEVLAHPISNALTKAVPPLTRSLLLVIAEHGAARPICYLDHSFCSPNWISIFGKLFWETKYACSDLVHCARGHHLRHSPRGFGSGGYGGLVKSTVANVWLLGNAHACSDAWNSKFDSTEITECGRL